MKLIDRIFKLEEINGANRCPTYLFRWTLFSWKRFGYGVYLHHFVGNDWSRDMHDHPKRFISIGLRGRYVEETPVNGGDAPRILEDGKSHRERVYTAPWIRTFPANHIHRLRLIDRKPCWTLVIVLRAVRPWGFWHAGQFIGWREYVKGASSTIADAMKDCA